MATHVETHHVDALIGDYLRDAEAGRVRDPDGGAYTPAALRSLHRSLGQVEAALRDAEVTALDELPPELLGSQVVERAGLPPSRLDAIVHALRVLSAYSADRRPARSPAPAEPQPATEPRTPTFAMLALGARVSVWMERIIVIAFILAAIGLALELV